MNKAVRTSWQDVRDIIHGRVLDLTYKLGDKLPRDEDIAEELGCARSTVQRAMQDLSDAGIIERKRKGGTTVRADPVTRAVLEIPVTRTEVEAAGQAYGYALRSCARAVPPEGVAALIGAGEALHVEALHLADGTPYLFEDRWVNLQTSGEIEAVDLTSKSANEWLVENKPYTRCDVSLYAVEADADMAEVMRVAQGAALLVIERTTWLGDAPITSVRAVTRPGYRLET